ncbi:MAG: membrane protein insertase YidC, partial [Sphaerochaetaceae bacterium]|nr:membrane protein insertase YidC [Sphaerochaetaceae bacterium]
MDGRTILAIVLCVIVIIGNSVYTASRAQQAEYQQTIENLAKEQEAEEKAQLESVYSVAKEENISSEKFKYETDIFEIVFDPCGASISSMVMKDHANADGNHVDIVFKGEGDHNAFLTYWNDSTTDPILDPFTYTISDNKVIFSRDFKGSKGEEFTMVKTFEFREGDYLIGVTTDIVSKSDSFTGIGLDYAYTLAYEPQVGPAFEVIKNNNYDYRRAYVNIIKDNGKTKKKMISYSSGTYSSKETDNLKWISLTSKYFTVVAIPEVNTTLNYKFQAIQNNDGTISQTNGIFVSRPATQGSSSDTVYFYCGPQLKSYMGSYYNGNNGWGFRNLNLDEAMESGSWLSWLENLLKALLNLFYKIIPNYGVGIILVTITLKLLLWPLTKKGTESTAKMSALGPKLEELKVKYQDNPQKMNQATMELYKEEGVSPMGGCLPMLLQFPILIAFYGLLNRHFELRGAMFIPGWIVDLSVPETIYTLGFNIPLLGNQIHLLPIIYTVSMIFSMKITSSGQQNNQQQGTMKFMTYG